MKSRSQFLALVLSIAALFTGVISAQSLSANESVSVAIRGVPTSEQGRISGQYVVSGSGYLSLPLLKDGIKASGRSASSVAKSIEAAYKKAGMYKDPRITIISNQDVNDKIEKERQRGKELVNIGGHVRASGPKPYHNGMTLFSAISAAGGPDPFGAMNRVELFHKGRRKVYDMKKAADMNVRVHPGDIINVPEKNAFGR